MGAAYSFVSRWQVPASAGLCWGEVERMLLTGAGPSWWSGVVLERPPAAIAAGESLVLAVRSPLGYRLRVHLTITDVEPGRAIAAASEGDLRGAGRVRIEEAEEAASVVFRWEVETERRWMNATAFLLRPVFARAHGRVMARGERGLRAALSQR